METEILQLIDHLNNKYATYTKRSVEDEIKCQEFIDNHTYIFTEGKSYYKVIASSYGNQSAYAFIVKEDNKQFKKGDILKPASWNAPAKNKARGNVFVPCSYKNFDWAGI